MAAASQHFGLVEGHEFVLVTSKSNRGKFVVWQAVAQVCPAFVQSFTSTVVQSPMLPSKSPFAQHTPFDLSMPAQSHTGICRFSSVLCTVAPRVHTGVGGRHSSMQSLRKSYSVSFSKQ